MSKLQLPIPVTLAAHPPRLLFLDGIRGFLALSVVLSHTYGALTSWSSRMPVRGAYLAVDCFFVISGFVLTHTLTQRPDSWIGYFGKRLARLWPLHVASMMLILVLLRNNGLHGQFVPAWWHPGVIRAVWANILMLQNLSWLKGIADQAINEPSWSISVEFWVSGLVLYPLVKARGYGALCLAIVAYASLRWCSPYPFQTFGDIGLPLSGGLLRGIGGISLGNAAFKFVAYLRRQRAPIASAAISYGKYVLLLPLAFVVYAGDSRLCWIALILFVLFIVIASLEATPDRILGSAVPVWLGEVSFSVYLMHMAVIVCLTPKSYAQLWGNQGAALYTLALAVVLAAVTHYGFEAPSRRYLYGLLRSRRRKHVVVQPRLRTGSGKNRPVILP